MGDVIAAVPGPVWLGALALIALGLVVVAGLSYASHRAPMDTDLWPGGEYGSLLDDEDDEDTGQTDEAEPPLVPGWGEERW